MGTKAPSISPNAPPTLKPTSNRRNIRCVDDEKVFKIKFKTDNKSKVENQIFVYQRKSRGWKNIVKLKDLPNNEIFQYRLCLKQFSCYKFVIKDKEKNGLGKNSFYKVYWGGKRVYILLFVFYSYY